MNNTEEVIRENWFKNHVAEFKKLNSRVSTLTWSEPNSINYYVRYVFDGSKLYVSGDTGEAVFSLTEKASLELIQRYPVDYFHSKLSAFCEDKYSFDSDTAIEGIKEYIGYANEDKNLDEDGNEYLSDKFNQRVNNYISALYRLIKESKSCFNKNNWKDEINNVYDNLTDYDLDVNEWIFSVGDVIPMRVQGYLIGLKMAYEQLKLVKP